MIMQIKAHHGEVYALFNKKFSSFALFEGKSGKNFIPHQVSPKYHSRDDDKKFIAGLRTWLLNFQHDAGTSKAFSLSEIKEGHNFDLVCKILHVCEVSKDNWMLFLWDGTDTPPLSIQTKLEDEMENPLPLQLESLPLPRDVLCTFPSIGTILRVPIDQEKEKLGLHLIGSGRWMKFSNIISKEQSGLWQGMLLPSTWLQYLSNEDNIVIHRQRFSDERASSKWEKMPLSSFPWPSRVTETDHEHVPFVTLMDVLTYAEVTAKFKCVVRVLATYPCRVEDFRSPHGVYRIRLTLEDPTARIHAFLYAEDGETFFDGFPSFDVLKRKRNKLLGITERDDGKEVEMALRNPPWVQCCIKSYYLDKRDIWGSRHFRIFGTRIVLN
ncbi:protection of telomeres protein 1b isoform X2 [Telopea speciosissima]|uniref:protection of telomeres protein 1b isoform X2 n=1 Tax=Telopea speciosissima TaxID=54955 RepID=UPI001CC69B1B|nr:protection of telomeres protein 1b isoform X2 [Telopea speciosissima]